MNRELIKAFLNRKNVFAVVGASRDPGKYGYKVYDDLKNAGYQVYPVNPNVKKSWATSVIRVWKTCP